jgi:hypothetical protein
MIGSKCFHDLMPIYISFSIHSTFYQQLQASILLNHSTCLLIHCLFATESSLFIIVLFHIPFTLHHSTFLLDKC